MSGSTPIPLSSVEFSRSALTVTHSDWSIILPASTITLPGLNITEADSTVTVPEASIDLPATKITLADNPPEDSTSTTADCADPADDGSSIPTAGVVGIGLGAAIAGTILTTIAFAFWRHKASRRALAPEASTLRRPKSPSSRPRSVLADSASMGRHANSYGRNPVNDLPQRQGNSEYRQQLDLLQTGIKNCVESFFPSSRHVLGKAQKAEFARLPGPAVDGAPWIAALSDTRPYTRLCAIRSLVARMLLDRIDLRSSAEKPLLPPAILDAYQSLVNPSQHRGDHRRPGSGT